jgi:hypothetical protein
MPNYAFSRRCRDPGQSLPRSEYSRDLGRQNEAEHIRPQPCLVIGATVFAFLFQCFNGAIPKCSVIEKHAIVQASTCITPHQAARAIYFLPHAIQLARLFGEKEHATCVDIAKFRGMYCPLPATSENDEGGSIEMSSCEITPDPYRITLRCIMTFLQSMSIFIVAEDMQYIADFSLGLKWIGPEYVEKSLLKRRPSIECPILPKRTARSHGYEPPISSSKLRAPRSQPQIEMCLERMHDGNGEAGLSSSNVIPKRHIRMACNHLTG